MNADLVSLADFLRYDMKKIVTQIRSVVNYFLCLFGKLFG